MENVIYEAKPYFRVSFAFIVFCVITILSIVLVIFFWKKFDLGARCFLCFILAFLVFIMACGIYTIIDSNKVYSNYSAGKYKTIEGYIYNYRTEYSPAQSVKYDEFYVSNVYFFTPGFVSNWGYPLTQSTGSPLKDGIKVKIHYIPYKFENVIMKLQLLE